MRWIAREVMVVGMLASAVLRGEEKAVDLCSDKSSNMEMRQCYSEQQAHVNAQADKLATEIAVRFRKDAQDPALAGVVADISRRAGVAVMQSQKTWKAYRDQHCNAVLLSYTTGSGAGTAFEACMLNLGQERIKELEAAFPK